MTMNMASLERKGELYIQRVALPLCGKSAQRGNPRRLTAMVSVVAAKYSLLCDMSLDGVGAVLNRHGASSFRLLQYLVIDYKQFTLVQLRVREILFQAIFTLELLLFKKFT